MAISIETARKALSELRNSPIALERRIAAGVLSTFLDQQEKKELISKNQVKMKKLSELPAVEQEHIGRKFILPEDQSEVLVDENLVPFKKIGGHYVGCTVKNDNFHVHGNKQNR